jgi:hypothetical protein
MPQVIVFADVSEARQFEAAVRWMLDLPREASTLPGYYRSPGLHAPASAPPGDGVSVAPGWALRLAPYIRHPSDGRLALRVTQRMTDVWNSRKGELTAGQRNWVQSRVSSAAELAADWLVGGDPLEDQLLDPTAF